MFVLSCRILLSLGQVLLRQRRSKWYLVFSICACSNLNVTKNRVWLFFKKGFNLLFCLQLQTQLTNAVDKLEAELFVQQNSFPPAEGALVLEIACFILKVFTSVVSTPWRCILYFLRLKTPLMYYLFLFDVLKCFEYLVHVCCCWDTKTFQEWSFQWDK